MTSSNLSIEYLVLFTMALFEVGELETLSVIPRRLIETGYTES
jgi:hypothetical protein